MLPRDSRRERIHRALAPLSAIDLAADVFADLPVEAYKLGVHGLVGPALRGLDEGEDLVEGGGARERRRLSHRWRDHFPAGPASLSHHITAPSETTAAAP